MAVIPHDRKSAAAAGAPGQHATYRFRGFVLHGGGLFRCELAGGQTPVALGSRALDVLTILVQRAGRLVPKQTIVEAVWPRTVVEDSNLAVQIAALRRVSTAGAEMRAASGPSPVVAIVSLIRSAWKRHAINPTGRRL